MVKRDNVSQPNCESDGRAENKWQRAVVWLIPVWMPRTSNFHQFSLRFRERILSVSFSGLLLSMCCVTLHLCNPAQFLGDLRTRLSVTQLTFMLHLHERDVWGQTIFVQFPTATWGIYKHRHETFQNSNKQHAYMGRPPHHHHHRPGRAS